MGKSASAPPAPDYTGAAKATAASNLDAARYTTEANRVNTYTPYGSLIYSHDPRTDKWSQTVDLSPDQQKLLDQQNQTSLNLGNLQNDATQRVANSVNAPLPSAYDPNQATNNAADLINARLLPQQQRDQAALESNLANQGITPGSQAYETAKDEQNRSQNDARQQAQLQGITLGQNQQAQQYSQAMANRNVPLNELSAIRTGSQVTNPTFQQAPMQQQTAGADYMAAANGQNQYNMGLYNGNIAQNNAKLQFLGQLAGAGGAAMASDIRLKSNIKRIGTHHSGIGIYSYIKFGQPEIGVMAQELEKVNPSAVFTHPSGYKMVYIGAL